MKIVTAGAVNKLLSWKIFPTLSRLSYCVYLTHGSYQIVQTFTARTAIYFADITEWPAFFGDVIISLIMAVVLSLCIESPAINLEKFLFRTDRKNRENKTEEDPAEPRKSNEDAHINKSMEQSKASEDGNSNFTEIKLDETDEDSVVQYLNREDVECQM
ncbi:hypothetical protein L798_04029 [Zootermopsis nevadensis]|uniref:Nose resistant to fluoxetine protein 6 n=1 Tax=Zootermopsis nevadensis TaxID=136037 RepID=A0A067RDZ7_ZOONE|nr:hypothetical protein L798_04029 [Zootermopsis nevadensis]